MGKKTFKKAVTAAFAPATLATDLAMKVSKPVVDPIKNKVMDTAMGVAGMATPSAPAIELPPTVNAEQPVQESDAESLEEDRAAEVVRRRRTGQTQRTLLSSGLGGGQATVGRATLLGGG